MRSANSSSRVSASKKPVTASAKAPASTQSPRQRQSGQSSASTGSRSKSTFNAPCCNACGKVVSEDVKALQCDRCQSEWKCAECLNLPHDIYDHLVLDSNCELRWFCSNCDMQTKSSGNDLVLDMLAQLDKKLTDNMNAIDLRFCKLEERPGAVAELQEHIEHKMDHLKTAIDKGEENQKRMEDKVQSFLNTFDNKSANSDQVIEVNERIEQKVDQLATSVSKTVAASDTAENAVLAKLREDKLEDEEIQKRKTSIIIHGLVEPQSNTPDDRKHEDEDTIETLFHSLNLDDVSVNNVIRLGKRPDQPDAKPRPVKVVIASEEQKVRVLSKAKNLPRKQEGVVNTIFMHQDLTPKQRKKRQELVAELKERQSRGEKNLIIVNWKIVERKRSDQN